MTKNFFYELILNIVEKNLKSRISIEKYRWNKEIDQIELMNKKHKKVCTTLNYIQHFLILSSAVTGFISAIA